MCTIVKILVPLMYMFAQLSPLTSHAAARTVLDSGFSSFGQLQVYNF